MRVADYVINRIANEGVKHIFTVTGRGILYLTDAIARNADIQGISMHHEQSCAYAAYAYAKATSNLGVCVVSTGCGATNAITGCLCAWQDDIPCIFISGQNVLNETTEFTGLNIRTFGQQEANIIDIVRSITKYSVMIKDPENIKFEIEKAIDIATTGRKGPVWIDIPLDIQDKRITDDGICYRSDYEEPLFHDADVEYVSKKLKDSTRPVLLIGSGVVSAGAEDLVKKISKSRCIPVVFDSAAVDVYPDENELSIGAFGAMGGSRSGNFALQNSDFVLSIGCRLTSMQVGSDPDLFARKANIVVVDIDSNEFLKNTVNGSLFIQADAKSFLQALDKYDDFGEYNEWCETCKRWKRIFPKCDENRKHEDKVDLYYLADVIGKHSRIGDIILSDAGIEELVIPSVVCKKNGVRCIHPSSQGAMGFSLPAAYGAFLSGKGRVISVIGDGSIMMNLQELQTIVSSGADIKIFVVNNNCYAVIRKRQKDLFRTRTIGTDKSNGVSCPDFNKIADAFGLNYIEISSSKELEDKVERVLNFDGPVLCEIQGIENQSYLHSSFTINENRKMIRRSLEDQSPFLDREVIKNEMIIDYLG